MLPFASTSLVKIYYLPDVHAGYGIWTGFPTLAAVKEALDLATKLLVEQRSARWITSTKDAIAAPQDAQTCIVDWLRRSFESGQLSSWADIPPHSPTARMVVRHLGMESNLCGVTFAQFGSLSEAKDWIVQRPRFGHEPERSADVRPPSGLGKLGS